MLRRLNVKEQVSSEKETSQGFLASRAQTLGRAVLGLPSTTHMYVCSTCTYIYACARSEGSNS